MDTTTSEREIVNSRYFPHQPQRVFGVFANQDLLSRWWGPKGFTNTIRTFEFKPGGQWLFTMHSPEGRDYENESVFQEISEPSKITIKHLCVPVFVLEIILEPAERGTILTWVQRFETKEVRDKVVKYAGNANEENLDRLGAVLASKIQIQAEQDSGGSG